MGNDVREAAAIATGMGGAAPIRARPAITLITEDELAAHAAFVAGIGEGALWRQYLGDPGPAPASA